MARKKADKPRLLTSHEYEVLRFLWKWKLANMATLKTFIAPKRSSWKFYLMLRRLVTEDYMREVADNFIKIPLFTLTKKGFETIASGLVDASQERFQPQSVPHDYWASAFHLGEFVRGVPSGVQLFSEQEIETTESDCLPVWSPKSKAHIPDGYTYIKKASVKSLIAIEVEISQKTLARYEEMIGFLDRSDEIDIVLWLCASDHLITKITEKILSQKRLRLGLHNFVRLGDFQKLGWDSPILWGDKAKTTVRELMGQEGGQYPVNSGVLLGETPIIEIFLSRLKSPRVTRF